MSWQIELDFQDGNGWRDITHLVDYQSFKRDFSVHAELKPSINTLSFSMFRDSTIINLLLTADVDVLIRVNKDGADYFTGYVRRNYSTTAKTQIERVKIECVDEGDKLKRKIDSTFALAGKQISDTSDTSNSIVHQVLETYYGLSSARVQPEDISYTIDYVVVIEKEKTYWDLLKSILYEHGYVFYFDESGTFRTHDLFPSDTTTSKQFDNTNIIEKLTIEKRREKKEAVELQWWRHETITGAVIFNDTTGGDDDNPCNITLSPGEYYPEGSGNSAVYSEYKVQDRDVIIASNIDWSLIEKSSQINITTQTNYYRRAHLVLYNSGSTDGTITRLKLRGDAVVKGDIVITQYYNVSDTEEIEEIEADWVQSESAADRFTVGLARWYKYSDFTYKLKSRTKYAIGDIVTIDESLYGISNKVRITKRVDSEWTGISVYECEGIEAYTAQTTDTEGSHSQPPPQPPGEDAGVVKIDPTTGEGEISETDTLKINGNLVIKEGVAQSYNYSAGSAGWLLDNSANAEINNILARGTIKADSGYLKTLDITGTITVKAGGSIQGSNYKLDDSGGTIADWTIAAGRLYGGAADGIRAEVSYTNLQFAVFNDVSAVKTAVGFLGNVEGYDSTHYGVYVAPGAQMRMESGGELTNNDYYVQEDGAVVMLASDQTTELIRTGALGSGDYGIDIGGMYYSGNLIGGGGPDTATDEVIGGGGPTIQPTLVIGGGGPEWGNRGLLYSQKYNKLIVDGDAVIEGTITADKVAAGAITADKVAAGAITADKINVSIISNISSDVGTLSDGSIAPSYDSANNYWKLTKGDWRVGDNKNYIEFLPGSGLTMKLTAMKVSTVESQLAGTFYVSTEENIDPGQVISDSAPIEMGTENSAEGTDPSWGYISHASVLALQKDGGDVGIGTTDPQGYKLYVDGEQKVTNGLVVEGSTNHSYAGISSSDHLMLDSYGQDVELNWDSSGDVRLVEGGGGVAINSNSPNGYKLYVAGNVRITEGIRSPNFLTGSNISGNDIFYALNTYIPNSGDTIMVSGSIGYNTGPDSVSLYSAAYAERTSLTTIVIYCIHTKAYNADYTGGTSNTAYYESLGVSDGDSTNYQVALSW